MVSPEEAKRILDSHRDLAKDNNGNNNDILGLGGLGEKLTDEERLLFISNISGDMPQKLAVLYAIKKGFHSDVLEEYLRVFLSSRVSVKGEGRKDILKLAKSLSAGLAGIIKGESENGGFWSKFNRGDNV